MDNLKKMLKCTWKFIWSYKFTILTLLFFFVTCFLLHPRYHNQYILLSLSFIFLLNGLSKTNKIVSRIVTFIFAFIITFESYFAYVLRERLSFGMFEAIALTTTKEAEGILPSILVTAVPLFIGVLLLFLFSQKELHKSKIGKKLSFMIFAVYWVVLLPIYSVRKIYTAKSDETFTRFEQSPAFALSIVVGNKIPIIYRSVMLFAMHYHLGTEIVKYKNIIRKLPEDITIDPERITPEKLYLVVGESATSNHFSLYGYPIKTTPFLDSLSNIATNFKYYDAISSGPVTNFGVPMALTFATPLDDLPMYKEKNIIEMAQYVGYEVIWLSMQPLVGFARDETSIFSTVADERHYLGDTLYDDIKLIPQIEKRLKHNTMQFFILHQEGSHANYAKRSDEIDRVAIAGTDVTTSYDRTIHHTDRFFRKLFHTMERDSSTYAMLYFSDHGEIIGKGHGFLKEGLMQFQIPFLTLENDKFAIDSIVSKYTVKEINLVNNTSVINIMTELMGYQYSEEKVKEVLEASKYIKHVDLNAHLYEELRNKFE